MIVILKKGVIDVTNVIAVSKGYSDFNDDEQGKYDLFAKYPDGTEVTFSYKTKSGRENDYRLLLEGLKVVNDIFCPEDTEE